MRARTLAILLLVTLLVASRAAADDIVPSARVSSAVLVREGPSTDTAILGRLRPDDSARLVGEVSGWYRIELPDGTQGYVSKAWTLVIGGTPPGEALTGAPYKLHVLDVGTRPAIFVQGRGFALPSDAGSQAEARRRLV